MNNLWRNDDACFEEGREGWMLKMQSLVVFEDDD
jgi:hypothetical protein